LKHSPSLGAGPPVTRQPRLPVQPGKRLASSVAIQQAKSPARGPQFLQIVAKPEPKLTRVAFRVWFGHEFINEKATNPDWDSCGRSPASPVLPARKEPPGPKARDLMYRQFNAMQEMMKANSNDEG
jgi:hypothetical protein